MAFGAWSIYVNVPAENAQHVPFCGTEWCTWGRVYHSHERVYLRLHDQLHIENATREYQVHDGKVSALALSSQMWGYRKSLTCVSGILPSRLS